MPPSPSPVRLFPPPGSSSFIVLLGLLLEAPPAVAAYPEREARWRDLVVKCLIKITKSLPATINVRVLVQRAA